MTYTFENGMFELPKAFAHWWFLFSLIVMAVSIIRRLLILGLSSVVLALISAWMVLPQLYSIDSPQAAEVLVGQYNFYHYNPTPSEALKTVFEDGPDVFTIQEYSAEFAKEASENLTSTYPYNVTNPWDGCCYGIGVFSKFPIVESETLQIGRTPVIRALIDVNGKLVRVISLHTRPPAFPDETKIRNEQLMAVAEMASSETHSCIVLGDFNIVPWDNVFKEFLRKGNLTAAHDGLQLTYPMDLGFPLIPIDHITYSGNLVPTSCETVTIPGSDHRGLIAGFAFKE